MVTSTPLSEPIRPSPEPILVYLVVYQYEDESDSSYHERIRPMVDELSTKWDSAIEVVNSSDRVDEQDLPVLCVHDMREGVVDALIPYYIITIEGAVKLVSLLIPPTDLKSDPMFG